MLKKHLIMSYAWYENLPIANKVIIGSFLIWFLQALPKWGAVFLGGGETAASLMTMLITPRSG
jgi:hypothetical protein